MLHRGINPVESRNIQLSARFKSAWAFHQLLVGMDRMGAVEHFENKSNEFQSLFSRLRSFSESSVDPIALRQDLDPKLLGLEQEIAALVRQLDETDRQISPSGLRLFFQQIRSLDERILIEIVRFYIDIQRGKTWPSDRLDKADYVLSRLAELIAGPGLKGDKTRLNKVLGAISSTVNAESLDDKELRDIQDALDDQRSEVRWVKTFEELNESGRIELYRALKHDMGEKVFYPTVLPLVVEVNSSFRTRIDELRDQAEARLVEEFQRLSQLQKTGEPAEQDVTEELDRLQERVEDFRSRIKESNLRLSELVDLSRDFDDIAGRYESRFETTRPAPPPTEVPRTEVSSSPAVKASTHALAPDIELLQPFWSDVFSDLSSLSDEITPDDAVVAPAIARYRLEVREILAFRRLTGDAPVDKGLEQFVLAAAVMRWRVLQNVNEIRDLLRSKSASIPIGSLEAAKETCRLADAYVKHFSHLVDQAVFEGHRDVSGTFQTLQIRLVRDLSGLAILVQRLASPTG
jgi:hypothetical protein